MVRGNVAVSGWCQIGALAKWGVGMCYLCPAPCWSWRFGQSGAWRAVLREAAALFGGQMFKLAQKSCSQQVLWLCFPVCFRAGEYVVTKISLHVLFLQSLSAPAAAGK